MNVNTLTPEQMAAAGKANLDTLFSLTTKAFEGLEKLVELNLQVARASLEDTQNAARAVMSAKDAQELLSLQANLLQPAAERAASYSRSLYDIATSTCSEVARASEAQMSGMQSRFMAAVDAAAKNAPAGTEGAVNMVKSAITAANNAYESVHKASRQAADMMDANFQAVTNTAVKATQQATTQATDAVKAAANRT